MEKNQKRADRIRRLAIVMAGTTGLLTLTEMAAHAGEQLQHCEPLVQR